LREQPGTRRELAGISSVEYNHSCWVNSIVFLVQKTLGIITGYVNIQIPEFRKRHQKQVSETRVKLHSGVVVVVCPDPIPYDPISVFLAKGAILLGDAHGPDAGTDFLELERGMERMMLPEPVFHPREFSDFGRQLRKTLPERWERF